jgi:AbrB family looped-hinge helix DNA binding protein
MKATITAKGQITIPKQIRLRLGLETGQVLEFDETSPFLLAVPAFDEQDMRSTLGCAKGQMPGTVAEWLDATRGPVPDDDK